jgi:benzoate membrane transport protein
MEHAAGRHRVSQPVIAGVLTALVGFTSSSAVVLAGLRGAGASAAQAASGLLALCVVQGIMMIWLARRHRIPLTLAWSTPGAALLASTGAVRGGWPAAVGAFLVVAALIALTGLWPRLGRLIAAIPAPVAQAMLAGIVMELCLSPVRGFAAHPWAVGPILVTWLVLARLAPRWAVPAAFAVTLAVVGVDVARHGGVAGSLLPHLDWTAPAFTGPGLLSIAIPLYVVTMAGQNIPGVAVMSSYGYAVPWREAMAVTGIATAATATAGGHALNLAAISASLAASPDADPDPGRRWIASFTAGWAQIVLGLGSAALTTLVSAAPPGVAGAVAGLALLGTLAASLAGALSADGSREAAAITFVVAASGLTFFGIGAAFWALAAGLLAGAVLQGRRSRTSQRLPAGPRLAVGCLRPGRAARPAHRARLAGHPPRVRQGTAQQELDLGIGAAHLIGGPPRQGVVDRRVEPQQDALALGHDRRLLVERAGVHDLLGGLLAAQHHEQVRDHGCLALLVQLDDALVVQPLQRELDHADRALDDPLPRGDDGAGLLLAQHGLSDLGGVRQPGEPGLDDPDAG